MKYVYIIVYKERLVITVKLESVLKMEFLINFFEKKSKLFYIRKIMLFTVFMYLIFGLLYKTSILAEDPIGLNHRIFSASVFFLIYLGSFYIGLIKNNIYKAFYFLIFYANIHMLYLAYINDMALNFAFSIIIVIFISNLLLKPQEQLKTFNIIMIVLVSIVTIYISNISVNKFVFLMIFYVMSIASFLISKLSYLNLKNIKERETYYKNLFKKSPIGLVRCGNTGNILDINEYILELSQKQNKDYYIGNNIFKILDIEQKNLDEIDNNKSFEYEVSFFGDEKIWLEMTVEKIEKDENVYILAFKDISSNKKLEEDLTYLSFHDQMTGLYNYRYFKNEIERFNKSRKLPISILIIDIDRLKSINDSKGHIKGNEIIKNTADILQSAVRYEDILARVGGDEFGIILPYTKEKTAEKICKRIYNEIESYNNKETNKTVISISIGWATKVDKDTSLYETLETADQNMYASKDSSR